MTDLDLARMAWTQTWQLSLLIAIVALLVRLFGRKRPHLAHILWLVVLAKCLTPPVMTFRGGLFCWLQPEIAQPPVTNLDLPSPEPFAATPKPAPLDRLRLLRSSIDEEWRSHDDFEAAAGTEEVGDLAFPIVGSRFESQPPTSVAGAFAVAEPAVQLHSPARWIRWGLAVWLAGSGLLILIAVCRAAVCLRTIRRTAVERHAALEASLANLSRRLKLRRRVRLIVTSSRLGPAVVGLFRPAIILPQALVDAHTPKRLEAILAHELIHVRRGDLWTGLVQVVAQGAWWFHPLVWLANRLSTRAAEACCDEETIAELGCDPADYAGSLLDVLELKRRLIPVPVFPGMKPVDVTRERMERIMALGEGTRRRTPWWCWLVLVVAAACVLPGKALVMSNDKDRSTSVVPGGSTKPSDGQAENKSRTAGSKRIQPPPSRLTPNGSFDPKCSVRRSVRGWVVRLDFENSWDGDVMNGTQFQSEGRAAIGIWPDEAQASEMRWLNITADKIVQTLEGRDKEDPSGLILELNGSVTVQMGDAAAKAKTGRLLISWKEIDSVAPRGKPWVSLTLTGEVEWKSPGLQGDGSKLVATLGHCGKHDAPSLGLYEMTLLGRSASEEGNLAETQTGRLMFGVGVNSNAGLEGGIVLEENDVDRAPPKSRAESTNAFRGEGQQFRIEPAHISGDGFAGSALEIRTAFVDPTLWTPLAAGSFAGDPQSVILHDDAHLTYRSPANERETLAGEIIKYNLLQALVESRASLKPDDRYAMNPKWLSTVGAAYDLGQHQNPGQSVTISRIPASSIGRIHVNTPAPSLADLERLLEGSTEPLADVRIEGNRTISSTEMLRKIKSRVGDRPEAKTIQEDVKALLLSRWFFEVQPRITRSDTGPVLVFEVVERPVLMSVEFKGNKRVKTRALTDLAALHVGHPFNAGANKEAARRIEALYRERGFPTATVQLEKGGSPDDREVVFQIVEGAALPSDPTIDPRKEQASVPVVPNAAPPPPRPAPRHNPFFTPAVSSMYGVGNWEFHLEFERDSKDASLPAPGSYAAVQHDFTTPPVGRTNYNLQLGAIRREPEQPSPNRVAVGIKQADTEFEPTRWFDLAADKVWVENGPTPSGSEVHLNLAGNVVAKLGEAVARGARGKLAISIGGATDPAKPHQPTISIAFSVFGSSGDSKPMGEAIQESQKATLRLEKALAFAGEIRFERVDPVTGAVPRIVLRNSATIARNGTEPVSAEEIVYAPREHRLLIKRESNEGPPANLPANAGSAKANPETAAGENKSDPAEHDWARAQFYLKREDRDSAAVFAEYLIRDYPKSPRAAEARALLRELGPRYGQGILAPVPPDERQAERMRARLNRTISLHFENATLTEVSKHFSILLGLNIVLDPEGLEQAGQLPSSPVTINCDGIVAAEAFKLILKPLGLAVTYTEGAVVITSQQAARGPLVTQVYAVADLIVPIAPVARLQIDPVGQKAANTPAESIENASVNPGESLGNLADLIVAAVAPETWDEVGGLGSVKPFATTLSLVIRQSRDVHHEIAGFLGQMRRLQDTQVSLSMTAFRVPREFAPKRLQLEYSMKAKGLRTLLLGESHVKELRSSVAADPKASELQLPSVTLFNAQMLDLHLAPPDVANPGSTSVLQILPVLSGDNRFVRLTATAITKEHGMKTATRFVKDQQPLLVELTDAATAIPILGKIEGIKEAFQVTPNERLLLLITPKIVVEEEETLIAPPTPR